MSSLSRDVRHARLIARTEVRQSLRAIRSNTSRFAALVVLLVFSVPLGLFWLYGIYSLGRTAGIGPSVVPTVGSFLVPAVVSIAVLVAIQTLQDGPFPDHPTLPLSIASTRAVVLAKLLAASAAICCWLVVPAVVFAAAFGVGAGAPLLALALAIWLLPVVCCAVPVGYLAGVWLLRVNRRLPVPTAVKLVGWFAFVFGSAFAGQRVSRVVADGGADAVSGVRIDPLPAFDATTAYASLLFAGRGTDAPALLGVAVGATLVAVGAVVARRSVADATTLWFDARSDDGGEVRGSRRPPGPLSRTKTGHVGWHYLRLARRSPHRLAHLLFLAFLLFPLVGPVADAPLAVLEFAPTVGALACALLTGAAFCLNPLGDERAALPAVLLSGTDASRFVRGRILAGLAIGLVSLLGSAALGAAAGVPPASIGWLVAFGLALSVPSGAVAAGLGALVPKYEPEDVFGVETVRPSTVPLFAFEMGTVVVGGIGLLLVGAPAPTLESVRSYRFLLFGYALVVAASAAVGYVVAVHRLRGHAID